MARIVADRVLETSTTTGTGSYTLAGTVTGYRTAGSVCASGDTFTYYAEDVDPYGRPIGGWETGLGTWSTGNILARTAIYASSNSGSAVSWSAGTRRVALSLVSNASLGPTTVTGTITASGNISGANLSGTNTGDQTALPNPNAITFAATGGAAAGTSYTGAAAATIDYTTVGAAPASHTHSYQAADGDLLAIAGLTGTSGLLRKTAADTWSLDTASYLTAEVDTLQTVVARGSTTALSVSFGATSVTTLSASASAGVYKTVGYGGAGSTYLDVGEPVLGGANNSCDNGYPISYRWKYTKVASIGAGGTLSLIPMLAVANGNATEGSSWLDISNAGAVTIPKSLMLGTPVYTSGYQLSIQGSANVGLAFYKTDATLFGNNLGGLDSYGYDTVGSYRGAAINFRANSIWSAIDHSTYLSLRLTPIGSTTLTEVLTVNGSGDVFASGSLGLGRAATTKLDIYGSNQVVGIIQDPGAAGNSELKITSAGVSNYGAIRFGNAGYIFDRTDSGQTIYFGPDATIANSKMRVDVSSGAVTILNLLNVRPLTVDGSAQIKIGNTLVADGSPNSLVLGCVGGFPSGIAVIDTTHDGVSATTPLSIRTEGVERIGVSVSGAITIPGSLSAGPTIATTSANAINFVFGAKNLNGTQAPTNAVGIGFLNESNGNWWKAGIVHERTGGYGIGNLHFLVNGTVDNSTCTLADSKLKIDSSGLVTVTNSMKVGAPTGTTNNGDINITGEFKINGVPVTAASGSLSGGVATKLVKWTGATSVSTSIMEDSGTAIGVGVTPSGSYKLEVNGSFAATSKSFKIPHPTKKGYLVYGSLESPYHGVRLTGEGFIKNGKCVIKLPDYICGLCKQENSQVQITNIQHGKVIWVDNIDIENNEFTVDADIKFYDNKKYRFFWSFTGIRKDIDDLKTEII